MQEILYWIWLVMAVGINSHKTLELIEFCPDLKRLYDMLHEPDTKLVSEEKKKQIAKTTLEQAQTILHDCEKKEIGILTWENPCYPEQLRHIYAPPMVLFYKGNPELLRYHNLLTVVGTRKPSAYSMYAAERLCDELAHQGIVLVSGCAVGLDTAAHYAAVRNGTPTIGILGCGVDYNYPKENHALKEKIIQNGLLLTEYFPGTPPYGRNFPVRNRILSGISESVLIVEAGSKSGCLITANLACEQGKNVFCLPPANIFDMRYSGQVSLLRDGAYPAFGVEDILLSFSERVRTEPQVNGSMLPEEPEIMPEPEKEISGENMPSEATPEQKEIIRLLRDGDKSSNMLCNLMDIRYASLTSLLIEMEMMGWIVNTGRDNYTLTNITESTP